MNQKLCKKLRKYAKQITMFEKLPMNNLYTKNSYGKVFLLSCYRHVYQTEKQYLKKYFKNITHNLIEANEKPVSKSNQRRLESGIESVVLGIFGGELCGMCLFYIWRRVIDGKSRKSFLQ